MSFFSTVEPGGIVGLNDDLEALELEDLFGLFKGGLVGVSVPLDVLEGGDVIGLLVFKAAGVNERFVILVRKKERKNDEKADNAEIPSLDFKS